MYAIFDFVQIQADHVTHSVSWGQETRLSCSFILKGSQKKAPSMESPPSVKRHWTTLTLEMPALLLSPGLHEVDSYAAKNAVIFALGQLQ